MTKKTAWSIIRDACTEAQAIPATDFEQMSAKLDHIAREADDAIQAVAASGSPPSPEKPVAWLFRHVDTDTPTVAILQEPEGNYAGFDIVPLYRRASSGSTGAPLDKPSHTTTEVKPWTTHNAKLTVEQFGDMLVKLTIAAHDYSTPIENGPARCTTIFRHDLLDALGVSDAGSTGGAPTRDELAKLISEERTKSHWRGYDMTNLDLADAILARWPAASRVPSESPK